MPGLVVAIGVIPLLGGCQSEAPAVPDSVSVYRDQILARQVDEVAPPRAVGPAEPVALPTHAQASQPGRRSLLTTTVATTQPAVRDVLDQMPDPTEAEAVFEAGLEVVKKEAREERVVRNYTATSAFALNLLHTNLTRGRPVRLSLAECIQRALENSYVVRIAAFDPAIGQTRVVEAEAAFDAAFFLDTSWGTNDPPVPNRLVVGQSDTRSLEGGIRQLLPTGLQASTALRTSRTFSESLTPGRGGTPGVFNPSYSSDFVATLKQPLLRGFGLEVNRAQINIAKAGYEIAREQFRRQVRDALYDVESAYWQLLRARRDVAILAVSVAQNKLTYDYVLSRKEHDATEVEINNALSRWQSRHAQFLESVKLVRDAEDALKNLINDREFKLSEDIEIIPSEVPTISPFAIDQFAEVRTAVDCRTEITEAKLAIEQKRIATMAAKNATLPQLDVSFTYDVGGLGRSADSSFDNLTTDRFRSYTLAAQFSYPLGNRGPRAAHHRAQLEERQAVATLQRVTDAVVQEVNGAVRTLGVRYVQIPPQFEAVRASERNLRALQARAKEMNPAFLETELNAVERLANDRRTLLQVVTDYNIAIVAIEKAKGTLLRYNNVVVTDGPGRN